MITDALLAIFLSWAVDLSPYPAPDAPPIIETRPHAFFVNNVCGGVECNVVGWYNDEGVIYLDETLSESRDYIIVHELVHYLQDLSGDFESNSCADSVFREREAYGVQTRYMVENGRIPHLHLPRISCNKESSL